MDLFKLRTDFGSETQTEIIAACQAVRPHISTWQEAQVFIAQLFYYYLEMDRYRAAMYLMFGKEFDSRPDSVRRILDAIRDNSKIILLGSSAMGKSFSVSGFLLCDWCRDPTMTSVRILSVTKQHTQKNAFSSIQRLYNHAIIPLPGTPMVESIVMDPKDRHGSISILSIPEGESGKNAIQGVHPIPRKTHHVKFGASSRIRIFADECEFIEEESLFAGLRNALSTAEGAEGVESVKVILACNPQRAESAVGMYSAPKIGWLKVNPDKHFSWYSAEGNWRVERIDAAYSPNIIQRRVVEPGFQTWEGYCQYPVNSRAYWTYCRGFFPLATSETQIIGISLLSNIEGNWIFSPNSVKAVAGLDLATSHGSDESILFIGRCGKASRYATPQGQIVTMDREKFVIQLDCYRTLQKLNVEEQCREILALCTAHGVSTDMLACDATGIGYGTTSLLKSKGHNILSIGWSEKPTHTRVLGDQKEWADTLYANVVAEMWYSVQAFLSFGLIKVSSTLQMHPLTAQLIGRRSKPSSRLGASGRPLRAIEEKSAFKSRFAGKSCDAGDALCMLVHCCRLRGGGTEATMEKPKPRYLGRLPHDDQPFGGYVDFSKDAA